MLNSSFFNVKESRTRSTFDEVSEKITSVMIIDLLSWLLKSFSWLQICTSAAQSKNHLFLIEFIIFMIFSYQLSISSVVMTEEISSNDVLKFDENSLSFIFRSENYERKFECLTQHLFSEWFVICLSTHAECLHVSWEIFEWEFFCELVCWVWSTLTKNYKLLK